MKLACFDGGVGVRRTRVVRTTGEPKDEDVNRRPRVHVKRLISALTFRRRRFRSPHEIYGQPRKLTDCCCCNVFNATGWRRQLPDFGRIRRWLKERSRRNTFGAGADRSRFRACVSAYSSWCKPPVRLKPSISAARTVRRE